MPVTAKQAFLVVAVRLRTSEACSGRGIGAAVHSFDFQLDVFRNNPEYTRRALDAMLRALTTINVAYLELNPNTPMVYEAYRRGLVRYQTEEPGDERWMDIPTALQAKRIDCEDIACWRAAEVNVRYRIQAVPFFTCRTLDNGMLLCHIKVRYPNGREEDPSRVLGMK